MSKSNISRTGGEISIHGLRNDDRNEEREFNSDDFNKIDYELRQFEAKKLNVHKVIESLVTGEFQPTSKDFDPQKKIDE